MKETEKAAYKKEKELILWEAQRKWEVRAQMKTASVRDRVAAAVIRAEAIVREADKASNYHVAMNLLDEALTALRNF